MFVVTEDGSRVMPWMKVDAGRWDRAYSTVQTSSREAAATAVAYAMAVRAAAWGFEREKRIVGPVEP
jgi:uncharacterized protein HemY